MSCCPETIFPFTKTPTTSIVYGDAMRAKYGNHPNVNVLYWDGTQYISMGKFANAAMVGFPPNEIKIDHGGISSGLIKLS